MEKKIIVEKRSNLVRRIIEGLAVGLGIGLGLTALNALQIILLATLS